MTLSNEELLAFEALTEKATPVFGRTEQIGKHILWAMYPGNENEGTAGKQPIAWFREHSDAWLFHEARSMAPRLIGEIRRLQSSLDAELLVNGKGAQRELKLLTENQQLREKLSLAELALDLIACPPRADGTYNRSREACEQMAREALARIRGEKP